MSRRWGIVPAAGMGTRIQPLAFSKELLPVGTRHDGATERPRAVCEYLLDRMLQAGATHICFVISPSKTDILHRFGARIGDASICYCIQEKQRGLCDAIFTPLPFIAPDDEVMVGLPDTIWFPEEGFELLPDRRFSFLLFPVEHPEFFDAVVTGTDGGVQQIQVKNPNAFSNWIWGAFKLPGAVLMDLHRLWQQRAMADEYLGTLVNQYLANGGRAAGVKRGELYVDVGTVRGYRDAVQLLSSRQLEPAV
jgi:glucose-1-phosphate thymidylyltransferase